MNIQPNELILLPTASQLTPEQHRQFSALEMVYSARREVSGLQSVPKKTLARKLVLHS